MSAGPAGPGGHEQGPAGPGGHEQGPAGPGGHKQGPAGPGGHKQGTARRWYAPWRVVQAAGGLVWRRRADGTLEVLVVHRPKYDDWTLPKGKLESGETHEAAAVREVLEETGLRCRLGRELPATRYHDRHGRPKRVRYWEMEVEGGDFVPNREVDEVRWVDLDTAARTLSYERDQALLDAFSMAR